MITVNGENLDIGARTLSEYLQTAGYNIAGVAVELNGEIIAKKNYNHTELKDGDKMEIVKFVGGG